MTEEATRKQATVAKWPPPAWTARSEAVFDSKLLETAEKRKIGRPRFQLTLLLLAT